MALTPYILPVEVGQNGKLRARKDQHEAAINSRLLSLDSRVEGAAAGNVGPVSSWAQLAAIAPTRNGQPGYVTTADSGTHTDPVVGGTVSNSGTFVGSLSPLGWRRTGDYIDASTKADQTALDATVASLQAEIDARTELINPGETGAAVFEDPNGFEIARLTDRGAFKTEAYQLAGGSYDFEVVDPWGFVIMRCSDGKVVLPGQSEQVETVIDVTPMFSDTLCMLEDAETHIYPASLLTDREDSPAATAIFASKGSTDGSRPSHVVIGREDLNIDPARCGPEALLELRPWGTPDVRRRMLCNIFAAPVLGVGASPINILAIGDSITNRGMLACINANLTHRGYTPTWIGTIATAAMGQASSGTGGPLAEAREGWEFGDYTYAVTDRAVIVNPGDEAVYNALTKANKQGRNPIIRTATGGDPAALVKNGMTIDIANYIARFGLASPDLVMIGLGTNDIRDRTAETLAGFVSDGVYIFIMRIRQALPNARILFWMPPCARSADRDAIWPRYDTTIRTIVSEARSFEDGKVIIAPVWAMANAELAGTYTNFRPGGGTVESGVIVADDIDPATGVVTSQVADPVHLSDTTIYQCAEVLAGYIAAVASGQI